MSQKRLQKFSTNSVSPVRNNTSLSAAASLEAQGETDESPGVSEPLMLLSLVNALETWIARQPRVEPSYTRMLVTAPNTSLEQ